MPMPESFGHQGAYRVVSEIGRGGFATVYKAYQASLDRHVAVKVLRSEVVQDATGIQRFQREARAAARLGGHPNIVTIHDFGEQDGMAYLVLEYVDGITLQERLKQPISPTEIDEIAGAVASALDFAHAHQLVHRDIKPSNVLLDAATSLTGAAVGTPEYMAPEQITGAPVDARSDIYALGAMLYRMFTGHPPFQGAMIELLHKHVHELPPAMAGFGRPISAGVEDVVRKALAKDPADRYASAGELATALSRALRPAILLERAQAALGRGQLDQADQLAGELLSRDPDDQQAAYVRQEVVRLRRVAQARAELAGPLDSGNWRAALDAVDRLRLREASEPEIRELVRRTDELGAAASGPGGLEPEGPTEMATVAEPAARRLDPDESATRLDVSSQQLPHPPTQRSIRPPMPPTPSAPVGRSARPALWLVVAALIVVLASGALVASGLLSGGGSRPAEPATPAQVSQPGVVTAAPATKAPLPTSAPPAAAQPGVATSGPTAAPAAQPAPAPAGPGSPALSAPRHLHTATLLDSGKLLVVAGREAANALPSAELFDPSSGSWSAAGNLAAARYHHTAAPLPGGKVLIAGGQSNDTTFIASAELFDPVANSWSPAGSMATPRSEHTATLLENGKVLVAGGYNTAKFLETAELYDPASNSWSPAAPMAAPHSGHAATRLPGGQVLVVGGFGTTSQATAERYDPASNSWSSAGTLADGRLGHTASLLPNGQVLVVGGVNSAGGGSYLAKAERYDPVSNSWSEAGAMLAAHSGHTATVLPDGQLLVVGGRDAERTTASAERYDSKTDKWTAAGALDVARWLHTASLLPGGRVLVAGGREGANALASTEQYDPVDNSWSARRQGMTLQLASQNNSGIAGSAVFTPLGGGKLRVEIKVNGAGVGPQPAHIHDGTCTQLSPGPPKFSLTPVTNGASSSDIDASIEQLIASPHAVHMHKSQDELSIYVACADIKTS